MRIHVLQHVPFEGLGSIEGWAEKKAATLTWTRFHELNGELPRFPAPSEIDLLIALGGPMSVNDEESLPWLRVEKDFIAGAIGEGNAILGICLGAQLIASAMGARVYPGSEKEIGWFPIYGAEGVGEHLDTGDRLGVSDRRGIAIVGPETEVFHWHGETFDLPPGATRLASTPVAPNQAFQVGERVIGLQFHLETTPETAEKLIAHCGDELTPGCRYIQSAEEMLAAPPEKYARIHSRMELVLEELMG